MNGKPYYDTEEVDQIIAEKDAEIKRLREDVDHLRQRRNHFHTECKRAEAVLDSIRSALAAGQPKQVPSILAAYDKERGDG